MWLYLKILYHDETSIHRAYLGFDIHGLMWYQKASADQDAVLCLPKKKATSIVHSWTGFSVYILVYQMDP